MDCGVDKTIHVLYVGRGSADVSATADRLEATVDPISVETATTATDALHRLGDDIECIVSAYDLADQTGLELLEAVRADQSALPFVLFTGEGDEDVASAAITAGVTEYVQRENDACERLAARIIDAVSQYRVTADQTGGDKSRQTVRESLELALDKTNSMVFEVALDTGKMSFQGRFERFFGEPSASVATLAAFTERAVHPEDRDRFSECFEQVITGEARTGSTEFRTHPDRGTVRWIHTEVHRVGDEETDSPLAVGVARDVTKRRDRDRELRRKETVFENARDSIFLIDVVDESAFQVARVNPAYCEAAGFTSEEVQGKTPRDLLGEAEGRRTESQYRRCIERNEPIEYDERLTFDGETTIWHTTLAPVEEAGTVEYLVGVTRDVTEKRQRAQELSELQKAVDTILANVPVVFFSFDEDGMFTRSQGSALERLGLESDDAVGASVFEMFEEHPDIPDYCDRALEGEQTTETVEVGDGIFEAWFQPLVDDGEVTGVVGIGYDITDRIERERELLRKSRAIEHAPIGVTMTDPTREDNPIRYENEYFEELTGYAKSEIIGRNHRFLQGERTAQDRVAEMRDAIDAQEPVSVELRNYRKDGTEFWNRVDVAPVFDDDELVNFVGFQQDVTERKQHEQQIRVFNRILQHNLRNRLNIARAHVNRIASKLESDSDRQRQTQVGLDWADLEAALDALADLRTLSEKAKELNRAMETNTEQQDVEINSYLSRLVTGFRHSHSDVNVSFDRSDDGRLGVFPSLQVAVRELLENAAKHSGPSPQITVSVEETGETVEISISDEGPGLSEQDQRVLEAGTETPLMHGNGLGLWIVYWIVTSHGGHLDTAVDEAGTTVTVSLPRTNTGPPVSVDADPELRQARNRFEAIFQESFDAMVITDPEGHFIEANAAATTLFGRSEQELLGQRLDEFTDDLDPAQVREGGDIGYEQTQFTLTQPDGGERFVEYSSTPEIVPDQHLFVFHDITERRRREQELTARTDELQRQNDRLNEFASVVSHDLRNPLNVATKQLERARQESDSDHLSNVATAHERMDALISDVLDLARAGRELGAVETVQLTAVVAQCWQTVESDTASLAVETDCRLRADPTRFRQLVENLLRNSVEHGSTDSRPAADDAIEHGGDDVRITISQRDDGAGFYVADDGPGVPAEDRGSIFESGYSTRDDGTGFGLAIVQQIADAHGWTVQVSDSQTGGARFDVTGVDVV